LGGQPRRPAESGQATATFAGLPPGSATDRPPSPRSGRPGSRPRLRSRADHRLGGRGRSGHDGHRRGHHLRSGGQHAGAKMCALIPPIRVARLCFGGDLAAVAPGRPSEPSPRPAPIHGLLGVIPRLSLANASPQ
jgi:hypothetical protein